MAEPFVTLDFSAFRLFCCIAIVFVSIALAYVLGIDEGRERLRRQLRDEARNDASKPLGLVRGVHRE